ncbi:conserved hypothetical protein [Theileria equi strain WA]|uniref:t-SNARE coiled-coil homology domain-containing protein n=1 Tax=Theileria equi strain WA TaxID=1537102 RepID=L1LCI5_THEEQ|nr:conserved hypothetical protein [Theileria equi strain WA]EKX72868.1 conserved hypothetical protein [Theileria equi strain WA]|eukprot:XP_004832320.1 conserved hypothetical protein [Theileria equi strain WA]
MAFGKLKPPYYEVGANIKYEKLISNNIKHIKADILYIEHNVGDLSNKFASRKLLETINGKLENVHALVSVTDGYLSEWELQIQQSPTLQYNDNSFDRLSAQFKRETSKIQNLSELVKQKSVSLQTESFYIDDASTVDTNPGQFVDTNFINDAKLDLEFEEELVPLFTIGDKKKTLPESLVAVRSEGIRNIKEQIEQAKDIFKDLATIVTIQDEGFQLLEKNSNEAQINSLEAKKEVEILANSRLKGSKRRTLWLCGLTSCALYTVFYCCRYLGFFY